MKILVCDETEAAAIEKMRQAGLEVKTDFEITPETLVEELPKYDGCVVRSRTKIRQPLIDKCPNLKIIVRGGVGLDNIDAKYARSKGIMVTNTPKAPSTSVAELTIGYMLMLARNLYLASQSMKSEKWEKKVFEGEELGGKTLGILGIGNIGKEVARRAGAFGMTVVAFDPYVKNSEEARMVNFEELLSISDYITLHLPKTNETVGLLGKGQFEKMKTGVRIINCSRGGIIDEDALRNALTSGKVAGAALDVFAEEPPKDWNLIKLNNVICSPHIGSATKEGQERVGMEVADILIRFEKESSK